MGRNKMAMCSRVRQDTSAAQPRHEFLAAVGTLCAEAFQQQLARP